MGKVGSIVVALSLGAVGLFSAASALVAFIYSFSSELPPDERLPSMMAGAVFGFLALCFFGGGGLLIVRALKRPPMR